jgi:hypothetical protein
MSPGTIDVEPPVACVGSTITFTLSGVSDTEGGLKRVCCDDVPISPVQPSYTWVIIKPDDSNVYGTGEVATVVADLPGTYACAFYASANRECPPSPIIIGPETAETCGGESAVAGTGPICQLIATVKEITFSDDHTVYEEGSPCESGNPDLCWGTADPPVALTGIDWASENNPDHPICYTRGTSKRLLVKIEVTASGAAPGGTAVLRMVGPDGVTGQGTFSVPCGTDTRYVSFTTDALPSVVKAYTPATLQWYVQWPGQTFFTSIGPTSHRIYVTYRTPTGSLPTNRRLNFVCNAAWQAETPLQVIEGVDPDGIVGGIGIHETLDDDPPYDTNDIGVAPPWMPDWGLMAGTPSAGECDEQANFMHLCLLMLGAPGGTVKYINASTDTDPLGPFETTTAAALGITEDLDGDGAAGETDEVLTLIFDFEPPPAASRFWNNFEAALNTAGAFYAVWPSYKAPSACALLLTLLAEEPDGEGAKQYWVYKSGDFITYVHPIEISGPTSCP